MRIAPFEAAVVVPTPTGAHTGPRDLVAYIESCLHEAEFALDAGTLDAPTVTAVGTLDDEPFVELDWHGTVWTVRPGPWPDGNTWGGMPGTLTDLGDGGHHWLAADETALETLGDPGEVLTVADRLYDAYVTGLDCWPEMSAADVAGAALGPFCGPGGIAAHHRYVAAVLAADPGTLDPDVAVAADTVRAWQWQTDRLAAGKLTVVTVPLRDPRPCPDWRPPDDWTWRPGTQAETLATAGVPPRYRVVNLGGGTQSTALVLAAVDGRVPGIRMDGGICDDGVPFRAIFADTGAENPKVYDHVARLADILARFGVGIDVVSNADLEPDDGPVSRRDLARNQLDTVFTGAHSDNPPWWVRTLDAPAGARPGMLGARSCSEWAKKRPLIAHLRRLLGVPRGARMRDDVWIEQWYGMSADEAVRRMRDPSREDRWVAYRYPLAADGMGWSRDVSVAYLANRWGLTDVPRSACSFCPLVMGDSGAAFVADVRGDRRAWLLATAVDTALRRGQVPGVSGRCFVHSSGVPLEIADVRSRAERAADAGQMSLFDSLFGDPDDDPGVAACSSACLT